MSCPIPLTPHLAAVAVPTEHLGPIRLRAATGDRSQVVECELLGRAAVGAVWLVLDGLTAGKLPCVG